MVTDSNGATQELTDYQPFGAIVYTSENSSVDNHYRFTGKELDSETALQYFGVRYMDNSLGRFTSVDPVMLVLSNDQQLKQLTGGDVKQLLSDPQVLNSYSYARSNPLKLVDSSGNFAFLAMLAYVPAAYAALNTAWDAVNVGISAYFFAKDQSSQNAAFLAADVAALSNPILVGGFGTIHAVQDQNMTRVTQESQDVMRLRHIEEHNYSAVRKSGFSENQRIYSLDIDDPTSNYVSTDYHRRFSESGSDFGRIDINLPKAEYDTLTRQGLVRIRQMSGPNNTSYQEIIFQPGAAEIINKYIKK